MSKHTPGPWTMVAHGGCFYVFGPGQAMIADNDNTAMLARMRGVGRGATQEEQRANGILITATPKLLEACKKTANAIRHGEGREIDFSFGQALSYCLTELEAAIAEADGAR